MMRKFKGKVICLALIFTLLFTGCSAEGVSDGLLSIEDLLRDVYHALRDIVTYEEVNPEESIPDDIENTYSVESVSGDLYGYKTLPEEEQLIYDEILTCINHYQEKCVVSTKDKDQLKKVYDTMLADHGELFWVSGYQYITHTVEDEITQLDFAPGYTMSEMEKDNLQVQVDRKCDEILSGIAMSASDYDKTKYVFDYLITNVDYDLSAPNNQNILSVFLGDATVCQGYANAAQYLLNRLGIETTVVTGVASNEDHAWNLVKLGGAYYYFDVTWGNSNYKDGGDTKKFINYTYLNMTSEDILKTHEPKDLFELPVCDSLNDNYFYREGLYYTYLQPDVMGGWIKKAYEEKQVITFKLANESLYREMISYFVDDGHVCDYCKGLKGIKYLTDEPALTVMFRFDEEYVPGEG